MVNTKTSQKCCWTSNGCYTIVPFCINVSVPRKPIEWPTLNLKLFVFNFHSDCENGAKSDSIDVRNMAKKLLDDCMSEINEIKLCGDCYMNQGKSDKFTAVCSEPHLMLWVKFLEYPYWPAKLRRIGEGPKPLEVYFFDEHTTARVSYKDCLLYTKTDPNEYFTDNNRDEVANAIKVSTLYFFSDIAFDIYSYGPNRSKVKCRVK